MIPLGDLHGYEFQPALPLREVTLVQRVQCQQ